MATIRVKVSQINKYIKSVIESDLKLSDLYVEGEISSFHKHFKSGHLYFNLKDETSSIKAVMFSSAASHLVFEPEDGMHVIVRGSLSVYERDGAYQLYAKDMIVDGVGAKQIALEQLKSRLESEGLFDQRFKKPINKMPEKVALITSKSGAALHDVQSTFAKRYPLAKIVLFPVSVQGEQATEQIINAINSVSLLSDKFDTCILTRGGGSKEDLWIFNDERIARAVFACNVPLISAIGHEVDTTISDLVADLRAATPTQAAELACVDLETIESYLRSEDDRMRKVISSKIQKLQFFLTQQSTKLEYYSPAQQLKSKEELLNYSLSKLNKISKNLTIDKENKLQQSQYYLDNLRKQMLHDMDLRMNQMLVHLSTLDPLKKLQNGFAYVTSKSEPVSSIQQIHNEDLITVTFHDGKSECLVLNTEEFTHDF